MIRVYRKTVTIKAEQFDGSNEMIDKYHIEFDDTYRCPFRIETLEGWLSVNVHDWIATGVNGEHWPIIDAVFKQTYAELPVIPDYVAEKVKGDQMALKNHETFVELGNLLDAYERNETGALERLDNFCEYHNLRIKPRVTPDDHAAIIIQYMKYKQNNPKLTDAKAAEILNLDKTTLYRIKTEFGLSRHNNRHSGKQIN